MGLRDLRAPSGSRAAGSCAVAPLGPRSIDRRDLGEVRGAEDDPESGPFPGTRTLRDEGPPVGFDDRPADRQAEAQARTSSGILGFALDEGLEDLLQPRRLEAATFVLEFDREGIRRDVPRADREVTASGRVPRGVDDEVPEDLLESARIGGDPAIRRREIEAGDQAGIPDEFGAILQALLQEPVRIDELRPQAQLRQRYQALVEQVVDQTRLVTDIPLHDLERGSQSRGDRALDRVPRR